MMMKRLVTFLLFVSLFVVFVSAQNPNSPFKFALITDTHVGGNTGADDLERTVKDINSQKDIAFVIVSGDVTEFGAHEELQTAKNILDKLTIPFYVIPGNHDSNWSESGNNDFLKIFGSETFSFDFNGYHFIGMASGPNMRMGPGQIPKENVEFFKAEMVKLSKDKPVIFVNHYPLNDGLNNAFEVLNVLHRHNVKLLLCGHGHSNRKFEVEGLNSAMCRSNLRAKADFGGYSIVNVDNDSIRIQEKISDGSSAKEAWSSFPLNTPCKASFTASHPDFSMNADNKNVKLVWSVTEPSDIGAGMYLQDNKLVYTNTSGDIKAVDARSGKNICTYKTNGKIYSTPTVSNNTVWCASSDGNVYGLNLKNGNKKFVFTTQKPIVSSPVCTDDKVIVAGGDGSCRAWNTNTGKLVWTFDSVKNFVVTSPKVVDDFVYFGSWGNEFYALNTKTGTPRWIWNSGNTNRMLSPAQVQPVITFGRIYLASPDRFMTVLDEKTGETIWRYNDPQNRVRESIGVSEDGHTVYAKTMDGKILAVDATVHERSVKWVSTGEDMGYELAPTPVVEKNGVVYAPTDKGFVYAYRAADGKFLWKYRVSYGLVNMILPDNANNLYVSTMDGKLVKLSVSK